jgi:hypothetical protein
MAKQRSEWKPLPGSQTAFLSYPGQEALFAGGRGNGKSEAMLADFARYVGQGHGLHYKGVIFRRQYKELQDMINKGRKMFMPAFPGVRFLESPSQYKFKFPDGEELLFRAVESPSDYWSHHGNEYQYIGYDELCSWPTPELYDSLKSLLRVSKEGIPLRIRATTNPFGPGASWVKSRFVDAQPEWSPEGAHMTYRDRPIARFDGAVTENTYLAKASPTYIANLAAIGNQAMREAWLNGSWDYAVGGFFNGFWDKDRNVIDNYPVNSDQRHWIALDWGFTAPFAVGFFCRDYEGRVIMYDEIYGYGGEGGVGVKKTATEVADMINEKMEFYGKAGIEYRGNVADSAIFNRTGQETSIFEDFLREGIVFQPSGKGRGSRASGWNSVREAMRTGKFVCTNKCTHTIRTIPLQMPDEKNHDDIDTMGEDHLADMLRYSLVHVLPISRKSKKSKGNAPGSFAYLLEMETKQQKDDKQMFDVYGFLN